MDISKGFQAGIFRFKERNSYSMLISVIAAFDVSDPAVFKADMVHKAIAAMVIGPNFDNDQVLEIARLEMGIRVPVALFGNVKVPVYPFLFPHVDMVRLAALCQHPGFVIAFRN
jgi:hypothetical protein